MSQKPTPTGRKAFLSTNASLKPKTVNPNPFVNYRTLDQEAVNARRRELSLEEIGYDHWPHIMAGKPRVRANQIHTLKPEELVQRAKQTKAWKKANTLSPEQARTILARTKKYSRNSNLWD